MNSKKPIIGVVIFIILLGVAGTIFWNYRASVLQEKSSTEKSNPAFTVEDKKITDTTKPFSIEITYPVISGLDGFNDKIKNIIDSELKIFKDTSLENDTAVKDTDPEGYAEFPREYYFSVDYTKGQLDENIASVMLSIDTFTGGAHGAHYFIPVNFDIKNNKDIKLADLFYQQKDYLKTISAFCKTDLEKQLTERLGDTSAGWIDDGTGPTEENFSVFLINPKDITFYFSDYQIAPYAAGSFTVVMPR